MLFFRIKKISIEACITLLPGGNIEWWDGGGIPGIPGRAGPYGYAGWCGCSPDNAGWPRCGWLCGNPIAKLLLKAANRDRDAEVLRRLNFPVVPPIDE